MYGRFYGLTENPFALTPDPRYLFLSEAHKEALASATYGIQERRGFVLILGEVGTGKTTLIRHLLGKFGPNIRTVFVFNPAVSFLELLQLILRDLELPCPSLRRIEMIETLNQCLLKEAAAGRHVVLIIDEAQHLSPEVLEEVRMLSNLETARGKLLQILLVGQPELGSLLGRPELRQIRQRIGLVAELKPLTHKETVQYVSHRLAVAGRARQRIFTRRALRLIYNASGGIPRLINVICDKALLLGYGGDSRMVRGRLVKAVLKDWAPFRRRPTGPSRRARRRAPASRGVRSWKPFLTFATLAGLGVAATAFTYFAAGPQAETIRHRLPSLLTSGRSGTVSAAEEEAAPSAVTLPAVTLPPRDTALAERDGAIPATAETSTPERAPAQTAVSPPDDAGEKRREIVVQRGDAFSGLVSRAYGRTDLTVLDFVRAANPGLDNIDLLHVGQRLRLPALQPGSFVRRADGAGFNVHLMTVSDPEGASFVKLRAAIQSKGRRVHVVPVNLTENGTAYRVMVGNFADRREAEAFYRAFRASARVDDPLWR